MVSMQAILWHLQVTNSSEWGSWKRYKFESKNALHSQLSQYIWMWRTVNSGHTCSWKFICTYKWICLKKERYNYFYFWVQPTASSAKEEVWKSRKLSMFDRSKKKTGWLNYCGAVDRSCASTRNYMHKLLDTYCLNIRVSMPGLLPGNRVCAMVTENCPHSTKPCI